MILPLTATMPAMGPIGRGFTIVLTKRSIDATASARERWAVAVCMTTACEGAKAPLVHGGRAASAVNGRASGRYAL